MDSGPGEHLGLNILEERAARIGGDIKIESDVGEGTRVILRFPVSENSNTDSVQGVGVNVALPTNQAVN